MPSIDVQEVHELERARLDDDARDNEPFLAAEHHNGTVAASPPTPPTAPPRASTAFLDGLRGLAAMLVLFQHTLGGGIHERGFGEKGEYYYFAGLPFIRMIWSGGNAAVVIFFVLSGYVLSVGPLHKLRSGQTKATRTGLLGAVIRRVPRLYISPLVVSFVYAILMHVSGLCVFPMWLKPQEGVLGGVPAEIAHWAKTSFEFLQPFRVHGNNQMFAFPYMVVVWTLPIELKGSMLVYGVLFLLSIALERSEFRKVSILVCTGTLGLIAFVMLQTGFKWSMVCFLFGILLAMVDTWKMDVNFLDAKWVRQRFSKQAQNFAFHVIFFLGWFFLSQPAHPGDVTFASTTPGYIWLTALTPSGYDNEHYYRYWQSIGALFLIYGLLRISWLQKFFGSPPLKFLGKVSFMLYLVHIPMLSLWGDRVKNLFGNENVPDNLKGGFFDRTFAIPDVGPVGLRSRFLIALFFYLPPTLWLSDMGTKYIDDPSVKFGRKITTKLGLEKGKPAKEITEGSTLPRWKERAIAPGSLLVRGLGIVGIHIVHTP